MATSPEHMDEPAQAPAPKAGKPPITANPAFPWIVALWFAALLGIGSLIVPVALLERASTASGLAGVLPMAAPPLGFTAQSLVALVGTVVGGLLGFVLARRIAAPRAGNSTRGTERKVLNAPEDIGEFGIEDDDHDDLPAPAGRRRALAIEQEDGPSDFLNVAPVPAVREPKEKPVMDETPQQESPVEEPVAQGPDFESADPAQVDEPRQEFRPDPEGAVDAEPFELDATAELDDARAEEQAADEHDLPQPGFERQEFMAVANAGGPVVDVHYAETVEAAATAEEPLPFSPPSMAGEGQDEDHGDDRPFAAEPTFAPDDDTGPESEEMVSDKQIFEAPDAPEAAAPELQAEEVTQETSEAETGTPAENQDEGLVQLVQRLGSTLEKHREWVAERAAEKALMAQAEAEAEAAARAEAEAIAAAEAEAAAEEEAAPEAPVPDEFDPAAAEDAAQAMAAYFGAPATQPVVEAEEAEAGAPETPAFDKPAATQDEPGQRYGAFTGTIAAARFDDEAEDEDEDEDIADLAATFTLPPMQVSEPEPAPRPAFDQPPVAAGEEAEAVEQDEVEEEGEDTVEAAGFANANPFKRNAEEFVRIEEPEPDAENAEPAVLFPNQEARKATAPAARAFDPPAGEGDAAAPRAERPQPSNDDNERALREALLNLQRMSK